MGLKLAIQKQESTLSSFRTSTYTKRWVEYCNANGIDYEEVDCYDTAIVKRLGEFDGLLWNFTHQSPTDLLMARHVLYAAEQMGLATFPNFRSSWHFDDKIAQKYLLEAVGAPLIPTYVFYTKEAAMDWLAKAEFPIVRKLRRGAGSFNVGLIRNYSEAERYVNKAFGTGFPVNPGAFADAKTRLSRVKGIADLWEKCKRFCGKVSTRRTSRRLSSREKGYVLFQEFMANNEYDTRITVVGDRAWGYRRRVRKDDFRASGSGSMDCDPGGVAKECLKTAFRVASDLNVQSIAYDFVTDSEKRHHIVEVSYGFGTVGIGQCPGWWGPDLTWNEGHEWPEHAMLEDVMSHIRETP